MTEIPHRSGTTVTFAVAGDSACMSDELLTRLFQRHFIDPVAAMRRLEKIWQMWHFSNWVESLFVEDVICVTRANK
jgi:hypothetical protein